MKELTFEEVEEINGGTDCRGYLEGMGGAIGFGSAALAAATPVGGAFLIGGMLFSGAGEVYSLAK